MEELNHVDKIGRVNVPTVAIRGMSFLPGMNVNLDISEPRSISAVEEAMREDQTIFLVTQHNMDTEIPTYEDLCVVGLFAQIKQMVVLKDKWIRISIHGITRAKALEYTNKGEYLEASIMLSDDKDGKVVPFSEVVMMRRMLLTQFHDYAKAYGHFGPEQLKRADEISNLSKLIDYIGSCMPIEYMDRQNLLDAFNIEKRYELIMADLMRETELLQFKENFEQKVKTRINKQQKEYFLREQMKVIRKELGDDAQSEIDELLQKTEELDAPEKVKEQLTKEIRRMSSMNGSSMDRSVSRGYIDTLLELPWNQMSVDSMDIAEAERILDEDHYGLKDVKERILEYLAVRQLSPKGDAPILCLVGPPGCGKTSIARSIAAALHKKYVRISLGGVNDEAEIRGHRRTYVGAMPGRIINGIKEAKVRNPLMLLDEVDKASANYKGDVSAALLEVLDAEQNYRFVDHYIDLPFDLSGVLFLATANEASDIPKPLRDRMEIISVPGYTANEKFHIAKNYLVRKAREKSGLKASNLSINDSALRLIISGYTREAGVRELERKIMKICGVTARQIVSGSTKKVAVTTKNMEEFLGPVKYLPDKKNKKAQVGIVRGLAWTAVGGVTLEVEVSTLPGTGKLFLTGTLGDVMKESAQAALSYVRSIAPEYKIEASYFEEHDIHIHIPEGATPKDGPSAGVTLACAILSAVTNIPVRRDIAMTGELTLRGRVLAIGGLKEKLLAANSAGMNTVCIPKDNVRDLIEIEDEIKEGLEIIPTEHVSENISLAFMK